MWKTLSDWLLAFLNMARESEENRASIRQMEKRLRDMEEALKLLALEHRHGRELESVERENLRLQLQRELAKFKELPPTRSRKGLIPMLLVDFPIMTHLQPRPPVRRMERAFSPLASASWLTWGGCPRLI